MHDPTRPTIEEGYALAIETDDLTVRATRGPVDRIIAAGWSRDTLGALLLRAGVEFDNARATLRQAEDNAKEARARARLLHAEAVALGEQAQRQNYREKALCMTRESYVMDDAAAHIADLAQAAALTDRALILEHLKTLSATTQALHTYAVAFGARTRFFNLDAVHGIASRALQLWLDPLCPHCDGRKFTGGHLTPLLWCQECDASGLRIHGPRDKAFRMAKSDAGHEFGRALLVEMDRKCERVLETIKRYLRQQGFPDGDFAEAQSLALRKLLAELRSTEAERD